MAIVRHPELACQAPAAAGIGIGFENHFQRSQRPRRCLPSLPRTIFTKGWP